MARKDNRGRNLKVGESQRKDGLYMYRYTDERTGKRVAIYDADLAALREKERQITLDELTPFLQQCAEKEPDMYVALYADESVPYREIVRVLNIANENHFKMVLATRPPENRQQK